MAQNYEYQDTDILYSLHQLQVRIPSLQMGTTIRSYETDIDSMSQINLYLAIRC